MHLQYFPGIHDCVYASILTGYVNSSYILGYVYLLLIFVELTERGAGRAIIRLTKHFTSLSPVFEVFSTQIYCHSILSNLNYGGARYIATGRHLVLALVHFTHGLLDQVSTLECGLL